ncbi:MAG: phenylacetate-CoA oxygenase subunit PaaC [Aliifodinibius sp.]|nr:phenylacetate-CoA oxygenase subunit PaaC [Fodinibius sp.]NIV16787.1 phenylacetate-CoA oxygenase subunit PaaC [Fodinibius sp.]NIY30786.1 phenylacetate-CoA oxygenase subunit PaaC [Fodinibius sp.]
MDIQQLDEQTQTDLFDYLLRLGDDRLILGHRLSEWCGHGPILEEDIALANIALDNIGQASAYLKLAGEVEEGGRTEDDLAYFREAIDFKNLMLLEQPNGDFAFTIVRQFLFDVYSYNLLKDLQKSEFKELANISAKSSKEVTYHLRHSRQWMLRLGNGTEESHLRTQTALDDLWRFTAEMFDQDEIEHRLVEKGIAADVHEIKPQWEKLVADVVEEATLNLPLDEGYKSSGSRAGRHTEHLGYILAEMQILPRSYPDAKW